MKSLAIAAALALAATPAAAAYVYSPTAGYETAEGNVNNVVFNATEARRLQWWYDSSIFGPEPLLIREMSFRFDSILGSGDPIDYSFGPAFKLQLDTLSGPLSTTFADNLPSPTTVLSGARTLHTTVGAGAGQTKPFGIHLTFATPYYYDPAQGDLIVDFFVPSPGRFGTFDFVSSSSLGGRVFNTDASATTGQIQSYTPVTRFDVMAAAPEPASWALMIGGFGLTGAMLRQRRRRRFASAQSAA